MSPRLKPWEKRFTCSGCGRDQEGRAFGRSSDRTLCRACYVHDLSTPQAAIKKQAILEAVQKVEPHLPEEKLLSAIEEVAFNLSGLDSLLRQLRLDADLFLGSSAATPVAYRLIVLLQGMGAENVALPICSLCGKEAKLVNTLKGDSKKNRICSTCYQRNYNVVECSRCGKKRSCSTTSEEGQPLCPACYKRDPRTWETCGICSGFYIVNARTEDGSAICSRCYRRPEDLCDVCGEIRTINTRKDGSNVCVRCYEQPRRKCGGCGVVKPIRLRANGDLPDLCQACWKGPIVACSHCGKEDRCSRYKKGSPLCPRCRLAVRLDEVLVGDRGLPEPLLPLKELILSVSNPQTGHNWLNSSPAVKVLERLASGELESSHEALDGLPQVASLRHLRELLVSCGALPWRDPYLARLERAIAEESESIENTEDALNLRTYGTWRVLRRTRRKYEHEGAGVVSVINARKDLCWAARFLRWLEERGKGLAECNQADVDLWLAGGKMTRYYVRGFVAWAVEHGKMPMKNKVPRLENRNYVGTSVNFQEVVAKARMLLQDENLDLADRVVGALVTIYAQPLTRVARLRTEDVIVDEAGAKGPEGQAEARTEEVFLRIGQEQVFMPDPLGRLLRELKDRRWRQAGIFRETCDDQGWLFPGNHPSRPQHYAYLQQRLNALGIEARPSRSAALTQLAYELPPAIVADMIGIDAKTAERWSQRAQGRWADYAASKARSLQGE